MRSNIKRNDVCNCMNAPNIQPNINSSTCRTFNEQLQRKVLLSIFHFPWFHKISVSWGIYELKSKKNCPVQCHKKWSGVYSKTVKEDPESLDWVVQNTLTGSLVDTSNTWFTYEWSYTYGGQCSSYQVVTSKIYCLKQNFLPPATTWSFTKIK